MYANSTMARIFEFNSAADIIRTDVVSRYKYSHDRCVLIRNLKDKGQYRNIVEVSVLCKNRKN